LLPPFREDIEESQLFMHSHITIAINGTFNSKFERLLKEAQRVDTSTIDDRLIEKRKADPVMIPGIQVYSFDLSDRNIPSNGPEVNSLDFSILYEILMMTDGATIVHWMKRERTFGAYSFKATIETPGDTAIRKLLKECDRNLDAVPKKDTPEYEAFKRGLGRKVYEIIAWPHYGRGKKHRAAGRLAVLSPSSYLVVDVLSKAGIYSRIEVYDKGKEIVTTHKVVQPASVFDSPPGEEYRIPGHPGHVIFAARYRRNNNYSLDSCWITLTDEFFVNPIYPSGVTCPSNHLKGIADQTK
jgi:hypothetical protein